MLRVRLAGALARAHRAALGYDETPALCHLATSQPAGFTLPGGQVVSCQMRDRIVTGDMAEAGSLDRQELVEELRKLRLKTFGERPVGEFRAKYPRLARLAEERQAPPVGGDRIRGLLLSAAGALGPPPLREAATSLFGLTPATFGKPKDYRHDVARACFTPVPSNSTFRQQPQYLKLILDQLVRALLDQSSDGIAALGRPERPERSGIRRHKLEARVRAALEGQSRPVTLWGEAGNGKSYLARNMASEIAAMLPADLPTVTIRRGSSTKAEEQTYQTDLITCLVAVGQAPQSWSLAAQELAVRELISGPRCLAVVVLDDVTRATVDRLIPDTCPVPVIITTRKNLGIDGPQIRVDAYEPPEALAAARRILEDAEDLQLRTLCAILGNRPVAIEISARMVARRDTTLAGLVSALEEDQPATLDSAYELAGEDVEKSLTRLYQEVYTQAATRPAALVILDALLWLTSGTIQRNIFEILLASHLTTESQRIAHAAGLAWLTGIGLVRQESGTLEINGLSQSLLRWQAYPRMYLTIDDFMAGLAHTQDDDEERDVQMQRALAYMDLQGYEYRRFRSLLSWLLGGDKLAFLFVSSKGWLVHEKELGLFLDGTVTMQGGLLDVRETGVFLWSSGSPARQLTTVQARITYDLVVLYYSVVKPSLGRLRAEYEDPREREASLDNGLIPLIESGTAQIESVIGRFDWDVTPPDGKIHKKIDPLPVRYPFDNTYAAWAFCGKRFDTAGNEQGSPCADCERFHTDPARLVEIEGAMNAILNILDLGSRLKSSDAAEFYAIRGKVQRLKGSPEDALRSYVAGFAALRGETAADRGKSLEIGYSIAADLTAMPVPFKNYALEIYDWLLAQSAARRSQHARIRYRRAVLLREIGRDGEALDEYDTVTAMIEQDESCARAFDISRVLFEKEETERRLGRISQAGQTMRRAIKEAEKRSDRGRLLSGLLLLAGAYLLNEGNPEGARDDFQRAASVLQSQRPEDSKSLCQALVGIAEAALSCRRREDARRALDHALVIVNDLDPPDAKLRERVMSLLSKISDQSELTAAPKDARAEPSANADDGTMKPLASIKQSQPGSGPRALEIELVALRTDKESGKPLIVLKEKDNCRYVLIQAGPIEAVSIAFAQQAADSNGTLTANPSYVLPHDMLNAILQVGGLRPLNVEIDSNRNGIFYACARLSNGVTVRARPSDCIALALWANAPILVSTEILDGFGFELSPAEGDELSISGVADSTGQERRASVTKSAVRAELDLSAIKPIEVVGLGVRATRPFVLLKERQGNRYLSVPISHVEAMAIDDAQLGTRGTGSLTHDWICDVLNTVGIHPSAATITKSPESDFCVLEFPNDKKIRARTGDAISICLQARVPVAVTADFFDEAGAENVPPFLEYVRRTPYPVVTRMVGIGQRDERSDGDAFPAVQS